MNLTQLSTYDLLEEKNLKDIHSTGYMFKHKKSGARVFVISNTDDNKVFYIGFRTPPEDETGVPHIIEHTTLCGSDKFPIKDPFVELVKGSLNTFLNAMTYPDKTVYPLASYNDKDFKNLMNVYMDAVFHPNITKYKEIFMQEGWHYELEDENDNLKINGVVYNEMKGAYSSPEEVLQHQITASLFPDNTYSKDSGGNPVSIPKLTYEDYLAFYHKYYHPSNSYIYLYGDVDIEERLDWLDKEYLSAYDVADIDSEIPLQESFVEMKDVESSYSIASEESEENNTYLAYNKVVATVLDKKLYQAFEVLDYALVSAPGAPVRQALIDAGIGEDVYGTFENGMLQPVFSIVAKNANQTDKEQFVSIIEKTLKKVVEEGLNKKSLLAGINSSQFRFLEADYGQFPKGLLYGLICLDSWLYDETQPYMHLECLDTFAFLKEQIETDYFENLIQTYILDNMHGSIITVKPQKGLNQQQEEALEQELKAYKDSLSEEEVKQLVEQTISLRKYQEEPSSEEDLKKIPMLTREDMKKEAMPLSNRETNVNGIPVVCHDIDTNGIVYLSYMFDAAHIAKEDIPYLGLLCATLGYVDTDSYSYSELVNEVHIYTGGIYHRLSIFPDLEKENEVLVKYEIKMKVLNENLEDALKLTDEVIRTSKIDDVKRLGEIIAQTKARLQNSLSGNGHTVAAMRGMSHFSKYAYYQDATHGIRFYKKIVELDECMKENPQKVIEKLQALVSQLFNKDNLLLSFTATEDIWNGQKELLQTYLDKVSDNTVEYEVADITFSKRNEAFTDASQIQYVSRSGNFKSKGFSYSGALRVLKMILSYDYLWINVRVKGGAYGCMNTFLRSGETYFVSYRDPNLSKTIEVYENIPAYLEAFHPDERDMTKYVIGTFGSLDTPLNPEAKGARSMAAYLEGLTIEEIQQERDEIRLVTKEDIQNLAPLLKAVLEQGNLCVIGNETKIASEKGLFEEIQTLL